MGPITKNYVSVQVIGVDAQTRYIAIPSGKILRAAVICDGNYLSAE